MGLYRRKDSLIWWMGFSVNGVQYQRSTGTKYKKLADSILAKVKTQIIEGKWFELDMAKRYTFDDLMEKYFKEHAGVHKKQSTLDRDHDSYKHLKEMLSGLTLEQISPALVVDYRNKRLAKDAAHSTILNELGLLRNAFNISIKHWRWCKENPVSQVSLNLKGGQIDRWLTADEEGRLLEGAKGQLSDQLVDMINLALNTGMRKGEILSLRIHDIDFPRKTLLVTESKSGEKRSIPLNRIAMEILQRRAVQKSISISGFIFSTSSHTQILPRNLNRAFYKAIAKAKIEKFRFHDLRHTFATRLVQAGIDLYKVSKLLGHKDISTTQRYAHHSPESLREGVDILDTLSAKVCSQQGGKVLRFYDGDVIINRKPACPLSSVG
jgi:site-specific recombinase XerD